MKQVILTKKRLSALHTALTLDDILHEKFKRLNEDLDQKINKLYHPANRIVKVVQRKDNINYVLQVDDIIQTGEGFIVYVR